MAKSYGLSFPAELFTMDVSQLEDEKLDFLLMINLNVGKTGGKYDDLYPFIDAYYQREPFKSSIPAKERELIIIRTGWLCQAEYECIHHIIAGLNVGLTMEEIIRIFEGPNAPDWRPFDSAILRATDELHDNYFICDDTWSTLSEQYDEHQKLEFILLVGQYTKIAMLLNSAGVQVESKHEGYGELSEKINNDERCKIYYEFLKAITSIYRVEIIEEQFESARKELNNLLMRDEFK